jgi:acyl-coenzyme A synthetase/AMP-(fatty) acid ligase
MTNLAGIVWDALADRESGAAVRLVDQLPKGPTGKILRRGVKPPA